MLAYTKRVLSSWATIRGYRHFIEMEKIKK